MAATLNDVIEQLYRGCADCNGKHSKDKDAYDMSKRYMEIPISADTFELPLLAFDDFLHIAKNNIPCGIIAARLYYNGSISTYKSLSSVMKDVLSCSFSSHLYKITMPDIPNIYYGTFGTVFDSNFNPVMMLSWIIQRKTNTWANTYVFKKPVIRLSPKLFTLKDDNVQKFLSGKFLTTTLGKDIYVPKHYGLFEAPAGTRTMLRGQILNVKAEIDECPFVVRNVEQPSVSVTNKNLLQLAIDHVDDIRLI